MIAADGAIPSARVEGRRTALVRRAMGGDQDAFEALITAQGDRMLATARKILRDPDAAEDAVQQTVILAWRLLPALRDPERFESWLYKVLVSACYGEARRARRFDAKVQALAAEPTESSEMDRWLERDAIEGAFRSLTAAHRAVVVLHYYGGLPLNEVAAIVGVSHGTARSRLHYALRALRAALQAADRPVTTDIDR
jgi:RNA polymerase sigma-70 factor (ECF subfamily)